MEQLLGIPVVLTSARNKIGMDELQNALEKVVLQEKVDNKIRNDRFLKRNNNQFLLCCIYNCPYVVCLQRNEPHLAQIQLKTVEI